VGLLQRRKLVCLYPTSRVVQVTTNNAFALKSHARQIMYGYVTSDLHAPRLPRAHLDANVRQESAAVAEDQQGLMGMTDGNRGYM